jgi:hypothetical protein
MNSTGRILVHFSCGAASAVAAKIACEAYAKTRVVEVINYDLSKDEHPDSQRFLREVENWIGQPVIRLGHHKYKTVEEVWRGEKFIVSAFGASCTRVLKREVGDAYSRPDDIHVFGYPFDEGDRISGMIERHPEMEFLWVLAAGRITKEDCYKIISAAGIKLPTMYLLGYEHNNCIGCCKGGKGYWNKIKLDFPEIFAARAKVQRDLGVEFRSGGKGFWLDELKPGEGNHQKDQPLECGLMCSSYERLVELTVKGFADEEAKGIQQV